MSAYGKVVWSEGLFLRPQHFQQQDRYFERYVEGRCRALVPHSWGFTELEIERDLLAIGKFALRRAAGVFPDGTPFRMPDDAPLPVAVDVGPDHRDAIVHLAIPLRSPGGREVARAAAVEALMRHDVCEIEAHDVTSTATEPALLEVGAIRTRLLMEPQRTAAYACLPIARIVEARADRQVILDEAFIPTVLDVRAAERLLMFMTELLALLHQRGDALRGSVLTTGRGSSTELAEYLMLQVINRLEPVLAHYVDGAALHPEALFRFCVSAAGELATFSTVEKRPPAFERYRHEHLQASFAPLMTVLRTLFAAVFEPAAVALAIEAQPYGRYVASVHDSTLYSSSAFVLAARADVPADELRQRFATQLRLGPLDRLGELVSLQLPGVPVRAIPVAPRELPYHAGFVYFELDRAHALWKTMASSGGIGMQVAGEFPGLALELWAIRRREA